MKITGPIEIVYVLAILFAILTVILLMGKGSSLIEVYKTATKEEKENEKYKKLSRVMGMCFGIIDILLIIISFMYDRLPEWFTYVFISIITICILLILVLSNIDIIWKNK